MPKSKYDWSTELAALTSDEFRSNIPLYGYLHEAGDVVQYLRAHQKGDKKAGRPGLEDAGLDDAFADEMLALVNECYTVCANYRMAVDPKADTAKLDRARFLASEIEAVLTFYLDDGVQDEDDTRLANVINAQKSAPDTADALALALVEWVAFARMHQKEIDGLGGFDAKLIDEAEKLSVELRMTPSAPVTPAIAAALAHRNRMLQLLDARVREVRAAAKFVFRAQPEMARGAISLYERKRRIDAKRAATRKKNRQPVAPAPVAPVPPANG